MPNITREDYKKAIKEKYEIEKNGDNSYYLENPSQAKLRDLCWKIFKSNNQKDDLNIFSLFLKSEFDPNKEDTLNDYIDKFKPVGSFLIGKREPANFYVVEFAAILVDFKLRPYGRFRNHYEKKKDNQITDDVSESNSTMDLETEAVEKKEITKGDLNNDQVSTEEQTKKESTSPIEFWKPVGFVGNVKRGFIERIISRSKRTIIATAIIFGLIAVSTIGTVIYVEFLKKDCMQWSGDHYDEVSCNMEMEGIGTFNSPETYDDRIINLRRIKVCDTTAFFKNNKAVVWYAKVGDSVEFFNTHGMHPENGKALRPVTHYIIDKYVKKH